MKKFKIEFKWAVVIIIIFLNFLGHQLTLQINQTVPFRLSPVFLHPYYPEKDASQPGSSPRQFPQSHIQKDAGCRCRQDIRYRFRVIDSHHIKIVG